MEVEKKYKIINHSKNNLNADTPIPIKKQISQFLKLSQLRKWLRWKIRKGSNIDSALPFLRKILAKADTLTRSWGGTLYFFYLPGYEASYESSTDSYREKVLGIVREIKIPYVDIFTVIADQSAPHANFPYRLPGHYNEHGYRLLAEQLAKRLAADNRLVTMGQ